MSKQINILVTGANGFIGSHILKYLAGEKEYNVTGLVRKTSNRFRLCGKKYNLSYASLNEPLEKFTKGIDTVIHTASNTNDWGKNGDIYRTNIDGTVNLLRASVKNGVNRFIHFSSTVVYGFDGNFKTTEDKKPDPFHNGYCITKALAEKEVLRFRDKIEIVILRPSNVFGPFDIKFTYLFIWAIKKGLPAFPKRGKTLTSPCYVKNLVSATERALKTKEGLGEAYNITDGNDIPWIEYLEIIARELRKKPPRLTVPTKPLYYATHILEKSFKLLKISKRPIITPHDIAHVAKDYSFSIEKAKSLLGYVPLFKTEEGIRESVAWYNQVKELP